MTADGDPPGRRPVGPTVAQWLSIGTVLIAFVVLPFAIFALEMYSLQSSPSAAVFAVVAMVPAVLFGAGSLLAMVGRG